MFIPTKSYDVFNKYLFQFSSISYKTVRREKIVDILKYGQWKVKSILGFLIRNFV